jgi:DNA-binding NtrC family response regulator
VIDDEPAIADLVTELLEMLGFRVETFTNSINALDRLQETDFGCVVCDIRMPEMGGQQLYLEVEKVRPGNVESFVMTSGDISDPEARLFANNRDIPLVAKPFTKEKLWQVVVGHLNRTAAQKCGAGVS